MTGLWFVLAAVVAAVGFGIYRQLTDGRARTVAKDQRLSAGDAGADLGAQATLVQFSTSVCAPCRTTHRLLTEIVADQPLVRHLEVDAETRPDLVERFAIVRTPTVLVLDATGVVRHRFTGVPRPAHVRDTLAALSALDETSTSAALT